MAVGLIAAQALTPAYTSPGLRLIWLIPLGSMLYAAALLAFDSVARADAGLLLRRASGRSG